MGQTQTKSTTSSKVEDKKDKHDTNQPTTNTKVICIDCDKKTQKELPANDRTSSSGQPCETWYQAVATCMNTHHGQISSCTREWDAFKQCHAQHGGGRGGQHNAPVSN